MNVDASQPFIARVLHCMRIFMRAAAGRSSLPRCGLCPAAPPTPAPAPAGGAAPCEMAELMTASGGDVSQLSEGCLACAMANQADPLSCTKPTEGEPCAGRRAFLLPLACRPSGPGRACRASGRPTSAAACATELASRLLHTVLRLDARSSSSRERQR